MIYLDPSVVLAELFAEDRRAPDAVWSDPLITSRLTEYEVWTRVNARGVTASHGEAVRGIFTRLSFVELARPVLSRALELFPVPVRTLDALHLATLVPAGRAPGRHARDVRRANDGGRAEAEGAAGVSRRGGVSGPDCGTAPCVLHPPGWSRPGERVGRKAAEESPGTTGQGAG
jgi:hypothetical protein